MATINGTSNGDNLNGTDLADQVFGRGGKDTLIGYDGDDVLEGGKDADEQFGSFGFDYVSYRSSGGGVAIDLNSGECFGGLAEGDRFFGIEGVLGNAMNDRIIGNAGANLLAGYGGADTLSVGGGADRFFYLGADSYATTPDRITDFSRSQGDRIVLGRMDANEELDGHQEFEFVGRGPFTDAGQLRWYQQNGDTVIEGNTRDVYAGPELKIVLDPLLNVQASDFIFDYIAFGPL